MRDAYYRDMDGFIFVYSVIDRASLEDVKERFESCIRVRVGGWCTDVGDIHFMFLSFLVRTAVFRSLA